MDQRRRDGQMISYYLLKTCDSMRKMQILYILPQPDFRLSFFSSLWNMRNQSCSWIVKLVAISVLVNNNFVEIWLKPWCLWRWARFPWGKRLIKAQEMEDLFCIKYLEKREKPQSISHNQMPRDVVPPIRLLHKDDLSFNLTHIPIPFWTPTFCPSCLHHLFQFVLFSSARKLFPKCTFANNLRES